MTAALSRSRCSSESGADTPGTPRPRTADPDVEPPAGRRRRHVGGTQPPPPQGTERPSGNPILLGTPSVVRTFTPPGGTPYFIDGPQWSAVTSQLFVSLPFAANLAGGRGILTTFKSDGTNYTEVRGRRGDDRRDRQLDRPGGQPHLRRAEVGHATTPRQRRRSRQRIATGYTTASGDAGAVTPFDTPNDLIALDDGTIYVTDPGDDVNPRPDIGHLFAIAPGATSATVLESYDYNPSPNGIALTKDQKTLLGRASQPRPRARLRSCRKYTVNADRSLTDGGKLVEMPVGSNPDGLAVDDNGNLYVAMSTGIAVFKSTGEPYGGTGAKIPRRCSMAKRPASRSAVLTGRACS